MTTTTEKIYDASQRMFVDPAIIYEVTATEILHMASKMPYASDEDARNIYDYLSDRFGFWPFRNATGITGPETLIERAIPLRAAAQASATA